MNSHSSESTLSTDEQRNMDAYWRACNYLCAGMLYLTANPATRAAQTGSISRTGC